MAPLLTFILSILMCATVLSSMTHSAQGRVFSEPVVVLEATDILRQFNGETRRLLVRLTDDGKVEWDEYVGHEWERQTGTISPEKVFEVQRKLNSIDKDRLNGTLGPYHVYIDTSVELQIRMPAGRGEIKFSVMNPWSPSVLPNQKIMPKEVKSVVCEIDSLHAQMASLPINQMCTARAPSH